MNYVGITSIQNFFFSLSLGDCEIEYQPGINNKTSIPEESYINE